MVALDSEDTRARAESCTKFMALGLSEQLAEAAVKLGWSSPSKIQEEAVPHAINGTSSNLQRSFYENVDCILFAAIHYLLCLTKRNTRVTCK